MHNKKKVVILANGAFPTRGKALRCLLEADVRICCDGAADKLVKAGMEPDLIIGDLDSLSASLMRGMKDKLIGIKDQDSNDLTKAVRYASDLGYKKLCILGASGGREDHSLGNVSLMVEYEKHTSVRMLSDFGEFFLVRSGERISSRKGEQFSIFSLDNSLKVSSEGLRYPLDNLMLSHWYKASLNEATRDSFSLYFKSGLPLIVYRSFV